MVTPQIIADVWLKNHLGGTLTLDDYVTEPFSSIEKKRINNLFDSEDEQLYFMSNAAFLFDGFSHEQKDKFLTLIEYAADGTNHNRTPWHQVPLYDQVVEMSHPLSELIDESEKTISTFYESVKVPFKSSDNRNTHSWLKQALHQSPENKSEIIDRFYASVKSGKERKLTAEAMRDVISLTDKSFFLYLFDSLTALEIPSISFDHTYEYLLGAKEYFLMNSESLDSTIKLLHDEAQIRPELLSDFALVLPYIVHDENLVNQCKNIFYELEGNMDIHTIAHNLGSSFKNSDKKDHGAIMDFAYEHLYSDPGVTHHVHLALRYGKHLYSEKGTAANEEGLKDLDNTCDVLNAIDYTSTEKKYVQGIIDAFNLSEDNSKRALDLLNNVSCLHLFDEKYSESNLDIFLSAANYLKNNQGQEVFESFVIDRGNYLIMSFFDGSSKIQYYDEENIFLGPDQTQVFSGCSFSSRK